LDVEGWITMWVSACPAWLQLLLGAVEGLILANFWITQHSATERQWQEVYTDDWLIAVYEKGKGEK
jgi:hypothetical protein